MLARRMSGHQSNRTKHPISNWSGTDVNTMRQRIHELGLPDKLCAFAFVLTPHGIRARWDQANPDIFVDEIEVSIGTPETMALAQTAKAEAEALVASRQKEEATKAAIEQLVAEYKPAIATPQPSWKRPPMQEFEGWEVGPVDAEEFASLVFEEALARVIEAKPGKDGNFACAEEPEAETDAYECVWCPYNKTLACHSITNQEVTAEMEAIRAEVYG